MPLFCNVAAEELHSLRGDACVWEAFKRRGAVTAIVDEVHDRCESPTSPMVLLSRSRCPRDGSAPLTQALARAETPASPIKL